MSKWFSTLDTLCNYKEVGRIVQEATFSPHGSVLISVVYNIFMISSLPGLLTQFQYLINMPEKPTWQKWNSFFFSQDKQLKVTDISIARASKSNWNLPLFNIPQKWLPKHPSTSCPSSSHAFRHAPCPQKHLNFGLTRPRSYWENLSETISSFIMISHSLWRTSGFEKCCDVEGLDWAPSVKALISIPNRLRLTHSMTCGEEKEWDVLYFNASCNIRSSDMFFKGRLGRS